MRRMNVMSFFAIILFSLSALILIIYLCRKNNNILNVREIVSQHFKNINIDKFTSVVFIGLPIIISAGCVCIRTLNEKILDSINIALPIYIGLQFSVVGVLCSLNKGNDKYEEIKEETFNEILFESIISIITLIISIILTCIGISSLSQIAQYFISIIVYLFLFNVFLNTFIVFKRLKFLFNERE